MSTSSLPLTAAQLEPQVSLALEDQLCFAVYAASRAMTAAYRPYLDEMGITYPQYLVLLVLWERGSIKIKDLGAALALDYGTLSPLVKRMESAGLVRRERQPNDERTVVVTLTDAGRALEPQARRMLAAVIVRSESSLDEIKFLRSALVMMTAKLKVLRKPGT